MFAAAPQLLFDSFAASLGRYTASVSLCPPIRNVSQWVRLFE